MDRQIVYPGQIPLETDLLNTNKFAMTGLAKFAMAVLGSETCLYGLHCMPTSPASMQIIIGPGQIYSMQNVDNTPYSSLPADTSQAILKQGLLIEAVTLTLTAPVTAGHSISYLIQVAYEDVDSGETVLPYYNAANPSVAYSGPGNSGKAQPGIRAGVCRVAVKSGISAPTGSQVTPQPDVGFVEAWTVTVTSGIRAITAADIVLAPNAPFLPSKGVYSSIQQRTATFAADTGSANRYSAEFKPALSSLTDGMRFTFKAREANTGASTFSVNGGKPYPLYSAAHQELQGGEIINGGFIEVQWDSALNAWLMCGNTGGALPVSEAIKSHHAVSLGQADERYVEKGNSYNRESAKKDFLPLSGGTLSGNLNIKGELRAEKFKMGKVWFSDDGNILGKRWVNKEGQDDGWLSEWILAQLEKFEEEISKLPSAEQITSKCVTNVRLGAESSHETSEYKCANGYVMTGWKSRGQTKKGYRGASRPLQVFLNGDWKTVESIKSVEKDE